ncbi:hypothetical protein GC207_05870 [bacterium]|nr:hypothetical protein [bacterium]
MLAVHPGSLLADPPVKLDPLGISDGKFQVGVSGQGARYAIEVSTNLTDWQEVHSADLVNNSGAFADTTIGSFPRRFYRSKIVLLNELEPKETYLFSGDTVQFHVSEGPVGTAWVFKVNSVVGGNASVGTLLINPNDSADVAYQAPVGIGSSVDVTVCAEDPNDSGRVFCGTVHVLPVPANIAISPVSWTMKLGDTVPFQAGAVVTGVGYVPFNQVYWKVNGTLDADPALDAGMIGPDGIYHAPDKMPTSLPRNILVGFSTSPFGAVAASSPITLVSLELTPAEIQSVQTGPAGNLTATLHKSDGTNIALTPAQVSYHSGFPEAADVDTNGAVAVGNSLGKATIFATDLATGATDSMVVESRPDVHVRLLSVRKRSQNEFNINPTTGLAIQTPTTPIREIEVTQPGAMLNLTPDLFFFRGTTNLNTNSISATGNGVLRFLGDGNLVRNYQIGGPVPDPSDLVARVEERTGFVDFGYTPGSGTVTMEYDDGVITRQATVKLTFSRLQLGATIKGMVTQQSGQAYDSEWLELRPKLANPGITDSYFMGTTQVRIREQGNTFTVARMTEYTGLTQIPTQKEFIDTAEYVEVLPSGPSDRNPGPLTTLGEILLYVRPHHAGNVHFVVDVPTDPAIPPVDLVMNVQAPDLQIRYAYGATNGSPVMANSYVDIQAGPNGTALFLTPEQADAFGGGGIPWYKKDPLNWFVITPSGGTNKYPYQDSIGLYGYSTTGEAFPGVFRVPGIHQVWLAHTNHPGIQTTPLDVKVLAPTGNTFPELALIPVQTQTNEFGDAVTLANQYAGMAIISPTDGLWTPGVPLDVSVRLFCADGQPRKLGKKVVTVVRSSLNPNNPSITTNYYLGGVFASWPYEGRSVKINSAYDLPPFGSAFGVPDDNGFIHFSVTVDDQTSANAVALPAIVGLTVGFKQYPDYLLPAPEDVPEEYIEYLDGTLVTRTTIPMAVSKFVDAVNHSLIEQRVRLDGHGVTSVPQAIPVATQRVRDAVTAGKLPIGADQAVFKVIGDASFVTALAGGVPTLDLGAGLAVINEQVLNNQLQVTVATDLAYFQANPSQYARRPITITFPNGDSWATQIQMFGFQLAPGGFELDRNIPLNAAFAHFDRGYNFGSLAPYRDEDGSILVSITAAGTQQIWDTDLQLIPSLNACWDANTNGLEDPGEDLDGDGYFTENDVALPALFRGVHPENPLVGFHRDVDPRNGATRVRKLTTSIVPGASQSIRIYADTTDHRRLDRQTLQLSDKYDPDLIPDFVSPAPDAELLEARHGPNLFDVLFFSVYNFMAEQKQDLPDPHIDFTTVGGSRDTAYEAYTGVTGTAALGSAPTLAKLQHPMLGFVDHVATPRDFHEDPAYLMGYYPFDYYGGILDQKWQRTVMNVYNAGLNQAQPLFGDTRMRPYISRYQGNAPTGSQRSYFGIDLDGVLFDPTSINFPKPRYYDPAPVVSFLLAQRLDEAPNSSVLRDIPVVYSALSDTTLTSANLLKGIGGTSGGFVDLTRDHPGRLGAESKSPGADVPGLHAGFQFLGRPEQLIDPRTSLAEDDIRDVILKRDPATGYIVREPRFFDTRAPRFVNGFAGNDDLKGPITTAAIANLRFAISTDPPNLVPDDTNTWKLRPSVLVREQLAPDNGPDMVVTSQSTGNELIIKQAADAVTDFSVDLGSAVLMSAVSGGEYLEACGLGVGKKALGAFVNFGVGVASDEIVEPYFGKNTRDGVQFVARNTSTLSKIPIEGVTYNGVSSLVKDPLVLPVALKGLSNIVYGISTNVLGRLGVTNRAVYVDVSPQTHIPDLISLPTDICDLLGKPFDKLKDQIKASYSAETFGGLGSAEAVGIKTLSICIPLSAQLGNGVYSATYSVTRKIDVQPREPTEVDLSSLPWNQVFASYPYADLVSDEEFLRTVLAKRLDPVAGDSATQIWRAIQRKSVRRDAQGDRYKSYKIRAWQMPAVSTSIAPFQSVGAGTAVGDFVLTPGETEIPVSIGVGAAVRRSNENSTGRARITTPGYEMVLIQGTLMSPKDPYAP